MKTFKRALAVLWSTKRGKTTLILGGAAATAVIAALIGGTLTSAARPGSASPTSTAGASGSSDLFSTATPMKTGSPEPAADGTVDIGGSGIRANVNTFVDPAAPEAAPDPVTGLVPFPAPVPWSDLTVPLVGRYPVQQCASSRIPQSRDYADELIAYLFTFDTSTATWGSFATPLHDTWVETVGGYGNGADQKEIPGSSWESRISSLGYSADQWQQWAKQGMRSDVRINAVHTTAGNNATPGTTSYQTRLTDDVTITRTVDGREAQTQQATIFVVMVAPCTAEYVIPPVFRNTLKSLQLGDFGRLGDGN